MKLRILDKNNNELFVKQGLKIDCTYESEYSAGDKIYISANNCYFFKIQLDSALKETVVYAPSGSFEYRIPTEVLERIYEEGAFAGTEHRILYRRLLTKKRTARGIFHLIHMTCKVKKMLSARICELCNTR